MFSSRYHTQLIHQHPQESLYRAIDEAKAYAIAYEIASKFNVPLPKIILGDFSRPEYENGVIRLPRNLPREMLERVIAHEMAHHIHVYYGVPITVPEAEIFASVFEEAWTRMKQGLSTAKCPVCGFPLVLYGKTIQCPRCKGSFNYSYPSPKPGLGKALGIAVLSAVTAYVLTDYFVKHPESKGTPQMASAVASGLVGFFAGLIL